ncbi:MAG: hypothetical protein HW390_3471 [Candidatus Brocadiaceae bacterium]|nr:hypothetical protein [Candidatus Brocadiaceae bacterium]
MSEEIKVSKHWIAKAKNDLLNADNNLKADETPFDTACFHCQQAAEKFLKAYSRANFLKHYIFSLTPYPLFLCVL